MQVLSKVYFGCFLSIINEIWLKKVKAGLPHWLVLAPRKYGSLISSQRQGRSGAPDNSGPRPLFPLDAGGFSRVVGWEESCCKTQVLYVYVFAYVCACTRVGWVTVGSGVSLKTPKPSE